MAALSCARARWCPDTGGGVARGRAQVRLKLRLAHLARPHPPAPPAMPFSFDRLAKPEKGTKWPFPKAADIQLDDVGGPETRNTLSLKELERAYSFRALVHVLRWRRRQHLIAAVRHIVAAAWVRPAFDQWAHHVATVRTRKYASRYTSKRSPHRYRPIMD